MKQALIAFTAVVFFVTGAHSASAQVGGRKVAPSSKDPKAQVAAPNKSSAPQAKAGAAPGSVQAAPGAPGKMNAQHLGQAIGASGLALH